MAEIYFEYYFKKNSFFLKPEIPLFADLKKKVVKKPKFYLEFYDYKWRNNIFKKEGLFQITDGVIIPKKLISSPKNYKNITYATFNAIRIEKKCISIINDLFGSIPSFYYHDKDILIYSTKIKPIISRLKSLKKEFSRNNAAINFSKETGYFISDQTYIFEIKRLIAASELKIKNNQVILKRYYIPKTIKEHYTERQLFDTLNKVFSVIFSEIKHNVGMTLSGGLDSRLIAAQIHRHNIKAKAITFGFKGSSDVKIAKDVSKIVNLKLFIERFRIKQILPFFTQDTLNEGFADHNNVFAYLLKDKIINNNIHYMFNGFLGDAILGGSYLTRKTNSLKELIKEFLMEINLGVLKKTIYEASEFIISRTFKFKDSKTFKKNKEIVFKTLSKIKKESNVKNYEDLINLYFIYHSGFRNTIYGVLSTRQYSEIIVPFMAYPFFLDLLKMNQHKFRYHKIYKKYLRKEFPKLAKIKSRNWKVDCYKSTLYQRLSEYKDGFVESVLKPKINSLFNKNIFRKDSYKDYNYWFRESKEFRKFMGTKKFEGFGKKQQETINNIIKGKL